jgi:pimeloyl-ACP methyl ester carboxylesterase
LAFAPPTERGCRAGSLPALVAALAVAFLAGCAAPIGADRVTTRQAYAQVEANALHTGKPSANTVAVLHRVELDHLAARRPDQAVQQLHQEALTTGERDLLYALAEMSYVAGERIRRSVKPWDPRDARDYYLGSAVYAWLFLFGEGEDPPPAAVDRRFRTAIDFYNYGLGLALLDPHHTHPAVQLKDGRRRLPVGELEMQVASTDFPSDLDEFDSILLADQFLVRGLSVRNRDPGIGTPLICVRPLVPSVHIRPVTPGTALLRGPASLAELSSGKSVCALELHPGSGNTTVTIAGEPMPLENDLTTHRAFMLNQSSIWRLGKLQFLAPAERIPSQLIMNQPFEPDAIPVVFVHGTFSSPVTWAEMANTLESDPEVRRRCQMWSFIYGSGNPLVYSIADLRTALTKQVEQLDPAGTNAVLRQIVIIGHSQGGLLTKSTAVDTGDRLWSLFSTNRLEDLDLSDADRAELRRLLFLEPLPFVKRVVFIATPHRGSYLSGGLARTLARRLVELPGSLTSRDSDLLAVSEGSEVGEFMNDKMPTSLDGMSPKNPALLAMADIPVASSIQAHSLIPVLGDGDPLDGGKDGVVSYESAHVDYVDSELVVRGEHSCLNLPATIEEVRRILHEHLSEVDSQWDETRNQPAPDPTNRSPRRKPANTPEVTP